VPGAPPPLPTEVDVTSPMPDAHSIWIAGAWVWGPGNRWIWSKAHWELAPFLGASWEPPRYEVRNGTHFYIPGEWR